LGEDNLGRFNLLEVDLKGSGESGFGEEVRSVVHAIELEVLFDDLAIFVPFLILLDFNSELEAQFIEPLEVVLLAHDLKEAFPLDLNVWHVDIDTIYKKWAFLCQELSGTKVKIKKEEFANVCYREIEWSDLIFLDKCRVACWLMTSGRSSLSSTCSEISASETFSPSPK